MEPVLFVMAILGCDESAAPCREVALVEARYRTEAACVAATEGELGRRDILYPTVVAQCRRSGARVQFLRGSDVLRPAGGALSGAAPRFAARSFR